MVARAFAAAVTDVVARKTLPLPTSCHTPLIPYYLRKRHSQPASQPNPILMKPHLALARREYHLISHRLVGLL